MSFVEDVFKGGNIVTGLAIGVGAVILAPVVVPVATGVVKPFAGAAVRSGAALCKVGRDAAAEAGEAVGDMVAEAKAELHQGRGT